MKYFFRRRSLKWRLVSRFSLALAAMMAVFYIGLIALIIAETSDVTPVDDVIKDDIGASIQLDGGQLRVVPTEAITQAKADYPDFWFIARDGEGREVTFGTIPNGLKEIMADLGSLGTLDIRVSQDSPMTAMLYFVDSPAGKLKLVFGGKSAPGPMLQYLLRTLHILYLPTTLIPLVLALIIIPLVVNSSLKSLKRVTVLASQIDVNKPGVRLPTEDVVEEIAPLVNTINTALARVDTDVSARERFLSDAAHELRTPIAILRTRLEGYDDSEENRRLLLDVSRIGAIAEQLLDIQRFAVVPVLVDLDLVDLCRQVVADLAPLAINAGYELAFETTERSVIVKADHLSIERALSNLVRNSIQHADGHGQITVKLLSGGIIEVSDEGEGIAAEEREKIFEPFYRSKPKSTGAGLGLNLVRQIARLHGGDAVALPSRKGALFQLTLASKT